ncbi:hypothetical protein OE903_06795 [Bacillus sp. B6(2022)]|nr:hypothetical protein [Bacillus sp. B6(2022)]
MSRIIKHETSVIPEQGRQTIPLQQVEFKENITKKSLSTKQKHLNLY